MRRKIIDRYTGERGTVHRRIAKGTVAARPGNVFIVFITGLNKGYALEIPESDCKYRGKYLSALPESVWLSEDK